MINPQLVTALPKTDSLDMTGEGVSIDLGDQLQLIDNKSFKFDETLLAEIRSVVDGLEVENAAEDTLLSLQLPGGKELPLLPEGETLVEPGSVVLASPMANITTQPDSESLNPGTAFLPRGHNADSTPAMNEGDIDERPIQVETRLKVNVEERSNSATKPITSSAAEELLARAESKHSKPLEVLSTGGPQVTTEKSPEPSQAPTLATSIKPPSAAGETSTQSKQSLSIGVPVQHAKWSDNLAGRVSYMLANNQQSAQISLNPAELGPIEVKVNMQNDQASVNFFAHNAGVRDAIEEAFPRLRDMLQENGVNLSQSSVSDQSLSEQREQGQLAGQEQEQYPFTEEINSEDSQPDSSSAISVGLVDHFV